MTQKRRRIASLFDDIDDDHKFKASKPNPVEIIISIHKLLLDDNILLPTVAVLMYQKQFDKFLDLIECDKKYFIHYKEVKCFDDIKLMFHDKERIKTIKSHISQSKEKLSTMLSLFQTETKIEIENEIDKAIIESISDVIIEIFNKFRNAIEIECSNEDEFIKLCRRLKEIFPYNDFKPKMPSWEDLESDSFVNIINSLKYNNTKYLEYKIGNKVFQFPQNKIYIRDCYITYYSKIWNYINSSKYNTHVIILGQPGIGKTSFIYYLLFMLRNDISTKYVNPDDLKDKTEMVEILNKLLRVKNQIEKYKKDKNNKEKLKELIEKKESILTNKTSNPIYFPNIENYKTFHNLDGIIDKYIKKEESKNGKKKRRNKRRNKRRKNEFENKIPFKDYTPVITFYNQMNRICASVCDEKLQQFKAELQIYMNKAIYFYTMIDKQSKEITDKDHKKDKKEVNEYEEVLNGYKKDLNEYKRNVGEKITELNNQVNKYNNYLEWIEDLKPLNDQKMKLSNEIAELDDKLTSLNDDLTTLNNIVTRKAEEKMEVDIIESNYSSSVDVVNEIIGSRRIFVVKSVNGSNTQRVYEFTNGILSLKNGNVRNIKNSIVITDTFGNIPESNIVISISSPDENNFKKYKNMQYHKIMYLDSFNDEEMEDWYKYCITNPEVTELPSDFPTICEMYGNVTRQVYFHYLYEKNYNKKYWEYYKELINSVVGTIGFHEFVANYIPENNLKDNPLSNIIMKYDLEYNNEGELEPKKSLIFVSPKIGMYVSSMLFPPKNNDSFIKVSKYYRLRNDSSITNDSSIHDECINRMLLKQIAGYKIALGEMIIPSISKCNIQVRRNSSSFSYFPFNAIEEVTYILDEDDIFDFIVNGVFIKIIYKNDDMVKLITLIDDNERLKEIKEKYIESGNTINYLTINEDEVIDSINGIIVGRIRSKVVNEEDQSPHDESESNESIKTICIDDSNYIDRKCYQQMIYIIESFIDANDKKQKNYLIFGNELIGKTVLADYLNDYFIKKPNRSFNILLIKKEEFNQSSSYSYCNNGKKPTTPYIVISDEVVVGEDEYSDAKMIIVIGNSSDQKIKTYQSKRCPLIMYIPPFTEEEINSFVMEDNEKEKVKKYGGIVGYYNKDEIEADNAIISVVSDNNKNKIVKDMLNGEPKSPLTKGYSSKVCIYNTFENDVTKSTRLKFLSKKVKEIANQNCIDLDVKNNFSNMFNAYIKEPNGDLAGKIFERLILYLCKNNENFRKLLLQYYGLPKEFTIQYVQIKDKADLNNKIKNIFKDYLQHNIIPLFDLSYNPCFPDVDFLLCFFGIQITVGLTHSLSAEIIEMLDVWKKAIKTEIEKKSIPLPEYLNDLFDNGLKFLVISNNRNVDLYYRKVTESNKFPEVLLEYIKKNKTKQKKEEKKEMEDIYRKRVEEINEQKDLMYISIDELHNYYGITK